MEKTKEQEMLTKAFENFDISLLQECIDAGYDMNKPDEYNDTYFSEALYCYGDDDSDNTNIPVKQVISFLDFAIKHGLYLDYTFDDCGEIYGDPFKIVKYCYNDEIVEFLLQHGMNINYMVYNGCSFYDDVSHHVFFDERGSNAAKFVYYRERLITYYGAKPAYLLHNEDSDEEKRLFDIILSFDLEKISALTSEEIIDNKLDSILIDRGRFYYSEEWYKEPEKYQKKLIEVFTVLLKKNNISQISDDILHECIYQQLPDLLEFLLDKGANPNVNCFNDSYKWVKSSAMYELLLEGSYFTEELYNRFMAALLKHGAIKQ